MNVTCSVEGPKWAVDPEQTNFMFNFKKEYKQAIINSIGNKSTHNPGEKID